MSKKCKKPAIAKKQAMTAHRTKQQRSKKLSAIAKKQAIVARRTKEQQRSKKLSANAKIIRDLMAQTGVKGNFKDYVIIAGKRLIDWQGSYDLVREADGKTVGMDGMAIVHKSKLGNVLGEEMGRQFWRPVLGRVKRGG